EAGAHDDVVGGGDLVGQQVEPAGVGAAALGVHDEVAVEVEADVGAAARAQEVLVQARGPAAQIDDAGAGGDARRHGGVGGGVVAPVEGAHREVVAVPGPVDRRPRPARQAHGAAEAVQRRQVRHDVAP